MMRVLNLIKNINYLNIRSLKIKNLLKVTAIREKNLSFFSTSLGFAEINKNGRLVADSDFFLNDPSGRGFYSLLFFLAWFWLFKLLVRDKLPLLGIIVISEGLLFFTTISTLIISPSVWEYSLVDILYLLNIMAVEVVVAITILIRVAGAKLDLDYSDVVALKSSIFDLILMFGEIFGEIVIKIKDIFQEYLRAGLGKKQLTLFERSLFWSSSRSLVLEPYISFKKISTTFSNIIWNYDNTTVSSKQQRIALRDLFRIDTNDMVYKNPHETLRVLEILEKKLKNPDHTINSNGGLRSLGEMGAMLSPYGSTDNVDMFNSIKFKTFQNIHDFEYRNRSKKYGDWGSINEDLLPGKFLIDSRLDQERRIGWQNPLDRYSVGYLGQNIKTKVLPGLWESANFESPDRGDVPFRKSKRLEKKLLGENPYDNERASRVRKEKSWWDWGIYEQERMKKKKKLNRKRNKGKRRRRRRRKFKLKKYLIHNMRSKVLGRLSRLGSSATLTRKANNRFRKASRGGGHLLYKWDVGLSRRDGFLNEVKSPREAVVNEVIWGNSTPGYWDKIVYDFSKRTTGLLERNRDYLRKNTGRGSWVDDDKKKFKRRVYRSYTSLNSKMTPQTYRDQVLSEYGVDIGRFKKRNKKVVKWYGGRKRNKLRFKKKKRFHWLLYKKGRTRRRWRKRFDFKRISKNTMHVPDSWQGVEYATYDPYKTEKDSGPGNYAWSQVYEPNEMAEIIADHYIAEGRGLFKYINNTKMNKWRSYRRNHKTQNVFTTRDLVPFDWDIPDEIYQNDDITVYRKKNFKRRRKRRRKKSKKYFGFNFKRHRRRLFYLKGKDVRKIKSFDGPLSLRRKSKAKKMGKIKKEKFKALALLETHPFAKRTWLDNNEILLSDTYILADKEVYGEHNRFLWVKNALKYAIETHVVYMEWWLKGYWSVTKKDIQKKTKEIKLRFLYAAYWGGFYSVLRELFYIYIRWSWNTVNLWVDMWKGSWLWLKELELIKINIKKQVYPYVFLFNKSIAYDVLLEYSNIPSKLLLEFSNIYPTVHYHALLFITYFDLFLFIEYCNYWWDLTYDIRKLIPKTSIASFFNSYSYIITQPFNLFFFDTVNLLLLSFYVNPMFINYAEISIVLKLLNWDNYSKVFGKERYESPRDLANLLELSELYSDSTKNFKSFINKFRWEPWNEEEEDTYWGKFPNKAYYENISQDVDDHIRYYSEEKMPTSDERRFDKKKRYRKSIKRYKKTYAPFGFVTYSPIKLRLNFDNIPSSTYSKGIVYENNNPIGDLKKNNTSDRMLESYRKIKLLIPNLNSSGSFEENKKINMYLSESNKVFNEFLMTGRVRKGDQKYNNPIDWRGSANGDKYLYNKSLWLKIDKNEENFLDRKLFDLLGKSSINSSKKYVTQINKVETFSKYGVDFQDSAIRKMYSLSPAGGAWEFVAKNFDKIKQKAVTFDIKNIENLLLLQDRFNTPIVVSSSSKKKEIFRDTTKVTNNVALWNYNIDVSPRKLNLQNNVARTVFGDTTLTIRALKNSMNAVVETIKFGQYLPKDIWFGLSAYNPNNQSQHLPQFFKPKIESIWGDTSEPLGLITRGSLPWDDDDEPDEEIFDYSMLPLTTRGVNDYEFLKIPNTDSVSSLLHWVSDKDPFKENLRYLSYMDPENYNLDTLDDPVRDKAEGPIPLTYSGDATSVRHYLHHFEELQKYEKGTAQRYTDISQHRSMNRVDNVDIKEIEKKMLEHEHGMYTLGKYVFEKELSDRVWKRRGGRFGTFPVRESNRGNTLYGSEYVKNFGKTKPIRTNEQIKNYGSVYFKDRPDSFNSSTSPQYKNNRNIELDEDFFIEDSISLYRNNSLRHMDNTFEGIHKNKNYMQAHNIIFNGLSYSKPVKFEMARKPWIYDIRENNHYSNLKPDYLKIKKNRKVNPSETSTEQTNIKMYSNNQKSSELPWKKNKDSSAELSFKIIDKVPNTIDILKKKNLQISAKGLYDKYEALQWSNMDSVERIESAKLKMIENRFLITKRRPTMKNMEYKKDITITKNYRRFTKKHKWKIHAKDKVGVDSKIIEPKFNKKRLKEHQNIQLPYRKKKVMAVNQDGYVTHNFGNMVYNLNTSGSTQKDRDRLLARGSRERWIWEPLFNQRFRKTYDDTLNHGGGWDSFDGDSFEQKSRKYKIKRNYDMVDWKLGNKFFINNYQNSNTRRGNFRPKMIYGRLRFRNYAEMPENGYDKEYPELSRYSKAIENPHRKVKKHVYPLLENDQKTLDLKHRLTKWKKKKGSWQNIMREYKKNILFNRSLVLPLGTMKFGNPFKEGVDVVTSQTYEIRNQMELPDVLDFNEPFFDYMRNSIVDEDWIYYRNNLRNILSLDKTRLSGNTQNISVALAILGESINPEWRKSILTTKRAVSETHKSTSLSELRYFGNFDPVEFDWQTLPDFSPVGDNTTEFEQTVRKIENKQTQNKVKHRFGYSLSENLEMGRTDIKNKMSRTFDIRTNVVIEKKLKETSRGKVTVPPETVFSITMESFNSNFIVNESRSYGDIKESLVQFIRDFEINTNEQPEKNSLIAIPQYCALKKYGIFSIQNKLTPILCKINYGDENPITTVLEDFGIIRPKIALMYITPNQYNDLRSKNSGKIPRVNIKSTMDLYGLKKISKFKTNTEFVGFNNKYTVKNTIKNLEKKKYPADWAQISDLLRSAVYSTVKSSSVFLDMGGILRSTRYLEKTIHNTTIFFSAYFKKFPYSLGVMKNLNYTLLSIENYILQIHKFDYQKYTIDKLKSLKELTQSWWAGKRIRTNWKYHLIVWGDLKNNKKISCYWIRENSILELKPLPIFNVRGRVGKYVKHIIKN